MPACQAEAPARQQLAVNDQHDLVRRYLPLAWKLARRQQRHFGGDLDDLFAEACVALVLAARQYDPDGGASFTTFAFNGIRHRFLQLVTAQHTQMRTAPGLVRLQGADTYYEVAAVEDDEPPGPNGDDLQRLRSSLPSLTPRMRLVVQLVYLDGLTHRAAAKALGISTARIGQIMRQALARLRCCFGVDQAIATPRRLPATARLKPAPRQPQRYRLAPVSRGAAGE